MPEEYIKRKDAIKMFSGLEFEPTEVDIKLMLKQIPAADVVEVKQSRWIENPCYRPCMFKYKYNCLRCGFGSDLKLKHCPECLSRMDKEER